MTYAQIAAELNVSVSTLRYQLKINKMFKQVHSVEDKDAVLALHAAGNSIRNISKQTNVPKSTVHRWIND